MAADDVEEELVEGEEEEPEDLEEGDLEDLDDDPDLLDDDAVVVVDDELVDDTDEAEVEGIEIPVASPVTEEDDDDDEEDDTDVEASLDEILKERLVVEDEEVDDEDEAPEADDKGDPAVKVQPKRPDEFVCQSCFLVKHPSQLADAKRQLCRDCV
jgi:hypothetical protein